LVNYFGYNYEPPTGDVPFAAHQSVSACPWNPQHKLVRVALKGREMEQDKRPVSNLVFLLDVSGSMNETNKLPLVKRGIQMLIDQLSENDRVAMVVYAGAAGKVLDSTTGDHKDVIRGALDRLQAGGSTNGGDGIRLAYQIALDNFITVGVNRVILCTDGDFNVGTTSNDELVKLVEEKAKNNIFLSVLGFGQGNLNDSMLEQISNKGNGNYAFIDTDVEARKVLVEQMTGTLITIAKDVKIQVEFNPARVAAYRLVGYENRVMAAQDFNDDKKDAGEIGAGHTVTAIYEIVPAGLAAEAGAVDELKYQKVPEAKTVEDNGELLTLKLRYKQPEGDVSQLLTFPLMDADNSFGESDRDFQFSAAVASFGMLLRGSKYAGQSSYDSILEIAESAAKGDESGYRIEFLEMVRIARELANQK
jgi:Ca-activated chloride channel family protein